MSYIWVRRFVWRVQRQIVSCAMEMEKRNIEDYLFLSLLKNFMDKVLFLQDPIRCWRLRKPLVFKDLARFGWEEDRKEEHLGSCCIYVSTSPLPGSQPIPTFSLINKSTTLNPALAAGDGELPKSLNPSALTALESSVESNLYVFTWFIPDLRMNQDKKF